VKLCLTLICVGVVLTGCGDSKHGLASIGSSVSGPGSMRATVYARGLTHVSALTLDRRGRLWATTSGATTHTDDGVYVVADFEAEPRKVVSGLAAPLGLV